MPRSRSTKTEPKKKKLSKKERDEIFAARLPGILNYHATMLADGLRNKLLYKAIKQCVTPETKFLDVGAGTGVWAIVAAKLGAKRVVAVEVEECLIPIIYKHAQENGVADRIEIIHGHSNDIKLKGKFDVIVSELFGNDALGKETIEAFISARDRFLATGGVLIPQKLALMAAPAHFETSDPGAPAGLPITTSFLKSIELNYGKTVSFSERSRIKLLAEPKVLVEVDFTDARKEPSLDDLSVSWKMKDLRKANAIAMFNRSHFDDNIEMDAFGSQSWRVAVSEFRPYQARSGELLFRVTLDAKHGNWSVYTPSDATARSQSYSPVFAFTRIRMLKTAAPFKKTRR